MVETLFDLVQIEENWGGPDDRIYRCVLDIFVPETKSLRSAIGCADQAALPRLAHTLRGAAINVGARRLAVAAGVLEHAAPEALPAALEALDRALQATLAAIGARGGIAKDPDADG
jgi:HPt (histidine-containing phosphotransfer) domain-containing protein